MALATHIVKNTNKETVISVSGANDTVSLALTGLVSADQVLGASGADDYAAPVVNVATVISSGTLGSSVSLRRGATGATGHLVFAGAPENSPVLQLNQFGFTENGQNNKDILVTHAGASGANVTTWVVLHKQDGYFSKVEYEKYGAYDDESQVGALEIPGAPNTIPAGLYDLPAPGSGTYETAQSLTMTSAGTPYVPGSSVTSVSSETAGLWRKKFVGNFGTSAGSGNDVTFCRTQPSYFGQADTYVGFGNQNLDSENNYTLEWVGYFKAPTTGTYNFWANVDDDVYFWIGTNALDGNNTSSNGHLYTNNSTHTKNTNSANLTAGRYYPVRIQFAEYSGAENMQILWGRTSDTTAKAGSDVAGVWVHNHATRGF